MGSHIGGQLTEITQSHFISEGDSKELVGWDQAHTLRFRFVPERNEATLLVRNDVSCILFWNDTKP